MKLEYFIPLKVKSAAEYEIITRAILLGCFSHYNFHDSGGNGTFLAFKNNKGKSSLMQTEKNKDF